MKIKNKLMDIIEQKNKNYFSLDLIKKSLIDLKDINKSFGNINNEKIMDFSKKFENMYIKILSQKKHIFRKIKNKIRYFGKYILLKKDIKLKNNLLTIHNQEKTLFFFIIPILKIVLNTKKHHFIQKMLLLSIKFFIRKMLPYEIFISTIELLLNLLINLLKSNKDCFYNINDEPFNILNDIIVALISYSEEIKIEDLNQYILTDIINLFERYLFSKNFPNIILGNSPIWIKLLQNKMVSSTDLKEFLNNKDDIKINNKKLVQKKLYSFLIKIYKFSLKNDYFDNIIIKNSILDLNYYLSCLNFLSELFTTEIKSIPSSEFKLKEGILIPKNKYIFFKNIKPNIKSSEVSIIFSFIILYIEENKIIDIMEIFDSKMKNILKLYINQKGYLILEQTEDKKLETKIQIKDNVCYFLCISMNNSYFKSPEVNLYINTDINSYSGKINNIDFSKEFSLVLGKNNYFGIIGDLFIINKAIPEKKRKYLFNLREEYPTVLRKICYNFQILPRRIRLKYKNDFNKSQQFKEIKECLKELKYNIIFEINSNDAISKIKENIFYNIDIKKDANNGNNISSNNINNDEKDEINKNNMNIVNQSKIIKNIKNSNSFINKENDDLFKNIFKMNYSYDVFYLNNGIDFLSFQLYNIFSKISDINLLNIYLKETLSFIMNIFTYQNNYFSVNNQEIDKIEQEMIIFFLTLLILLINKKGKIFLSSNVILQLIQILEYFNKKQLINEKNLILSILLDVDFYKNNEDIFEYKQIFNFLKSEFKDSSNKNKSLLTKEFFLKLLSLDFCFEIKEFKHDILIELICEFIESTEKLPKDKDKLDPCLPIYTELFLYFLSLRSEMKIYQYLKIIYFNFDKLKKIFIFDDTNRNNNDDNRNNDNRNNINNDSINNKNIRINKNNVDKDTYKKIQMDLISNINLYMETLNYNHCEFCLHNQIYYYLIYQEIINLSCKEELSFFYSPTGFMINPSYLFLKCFFSQIFNLSKKERDKFITIDSNPIDYIFSLIEQKKDIFNPDKFNERFRIIINYIKLLREQISSTDSQILEKILYFFKLIVDFLGRFSEYEIKFNKGNENTKIRNKKNEIKIEEKKEHSPSILYNEDLKQFFDIYLELNYNTALEELKNFVKISINIVTFPFYFLLLSSKSMPNENNKEDNKYQFFRTIIDEFIFHKIIFDINNDGVIIKNNIAFLICLYNYLIDYNEEKNIEFKNIFSIFFNNLQDKNFFNSKYIFNVNLNTNIENEQNQNNHNKKFILEIVCEIYFLLYEKNNFDIYYFYLIKGIFLTEKITDLFSIDSEYFLEEKNKDKAYYFFNQNYLKDIAEGEESEDIIFSVYFLNYLLGKLEKYEKIPKDDSNIIKNPYEFMEEIIKRLLKYIVKLFQTYNKKINYSLKNLQKKNKYKSYINLLEYLTNKYKAKKLSTDIIINHYKKENKNKEIKQRGNKTKQKIEIDSFNAIENNKNQKNIEYDLNKTFDDQQNIYYLRLSELKIDNKEKRNLSFSGLSSRRTSISEKYGFTDEIDKKDIKNDIENSEINNKNIYQKQDKIILFNVEKKDSNKKLLDSSESSEKLPASSINNSTKERPKQTNFIKTRLNTINIPFIYFRKFFHLSDINIIKQLFNPKEYYIWNKFNYLLKDIIFSQKKFILVSNFYKIKTIGENITKSSKLKNREFSLKHPIKLKNFICDDYYRPLTKPDLNFFNDELLEITHPYLNSDFLKRNNYDIDKINKIGFPRLIPFEYEKKSNFQFFCELVNDKGSYFGYIFVNYAFILFVNSSDKDPRKKEKLTEKDNLEEAQFYVLSYFLEERITDKNKQVIIFTSEIKEIIIRRFCFNYIGYEILMKNNKSYLFNFFNQENMYKFISCLLVQAEINKQKNSGDDFSVTERIHKISEQKIIQANISEDISFVIINDLKEYFGKNEFRLKHFNNEISNFNYLLLLNKYAARSYNDLYQYLVFPLLFLDESRKEERDLTKVIALNKKGERLEGSIQFIKNNYDNFGSHFNSNYSTSGYVLYYLVRMNPFTSGHIKLQSNQFDVPQRMFYAIKYYLKAVTDSEENRELIPEFYYNYEIFLNLNYLDLGYLLEERMLINDVETNDKNGIAEFIISLRQQLEKVDIEPWVDLIFGCNQDNEDNTEIYNKFPETAYEKYYDFQKLRIKMLEEGKDLLELLNEIRGELNILSVGIIPAQLFDNPLKKKKIQKGLSGEKGSGSKKSSKKLFIDFSDSKGIEKFLKKYYKEKSKLFIINDNYGQKLVIKAEKDLNIFRLFNEENKNNIIQIEFSGKDYLNFDPLSKMICELYKDIFLICRLIDRNFLIKCFGKKDVLLYHDYIITSVEFISYQESKDNLKNIITRKDIVVFGDETGTLSLIKIDYVINSKKQIDLKNMKIKKVIKAHNSLIIGILYNKRLNIIISYSKEGQIAINNGYDLTMINIIELGEEFQIKNIKISNYDLIYVFCKNKENEELNYIQCYSLNGIKFTELITEKKIIDFFVCETLIVVYENNFIEAFNLYEIEGNPVYQLEPNKNKEKENKTKMDGESNKNEDNKIIFSIINNIEKNIVIIYDDLQVVVEGISHMMLKK